VYLEARRTAREEAEVVGDVYFGGLDDVGGGGEGEVPGVRVLLMTAPARRALRAVETVFMMLVSMVR
jgi:hypothetical protein